MKSILYYPQDSDKINNLLDYYNNTMHTVIFTNGCFDLLHIGHLKVLNAAKNERGIVIVGLNSDESVRKFKGVDRPIMNQEDRSAILLNLECVDDVIIYDDPSVYDLVKFIKPDVLVKGGDYALEEVVGWDIVQSYGGRIVRVPIEESRSTTRTIQKVRNSASPE